MAGARRASIGTASDSTRHLTGLTNPVLLGTLLVPLGLMPRRRPGDGVDRKPADDADDADAQHDDVSCGVASPASRRRRPPKEPPLRIGMLPVARRDTERLRQILSVQRRLMDLESSPRAKRALMHRGPFQEALVWLEIHGRAPEALEHWRGFIEASGGPDRRSPGTRAMAPTRARRRTPPPPPWPTARPRKCQSDAGRLVSVRGSGRSGRSARGFRRFCVTSDRPDRPDPPDRSCLTRAFFRTPA